jgi:hypothetical protein
VKGGDVFDVNLLDRLSFGDLGKMLDHILEKLDQLDEEGSADEDDPPHDMLLVIANQIIVRMDSIIRDNSVDSPELLDQWKRVTEEHRKGFKNYVRTYLKEGCRCSGWDPRVLRGPGARTRTRRGGRSQMRPCSTKSYSPA